MAFHTDSQLALVSSSMLALALFWPAGSDWRLTAQCRSLGEAPVEAGLCSAFCHMDAGLVNGVSCATQSVSHAHGNRREVSFVLGTLGLSRSYRLKDTDRL